MASACARAISGGRTVVVALVTWLVFAGSARGGIASEAGASLSLESSVVAGNRAEAIAPYGRFVSGGGILVDAGGSLTSDNGGIVANRASLARPAKSAARCAGGVSSPSRVRAERRLRSSALTLASLLRSG